MLLIFQELNYLIDEYFKCECSQTKEQLLHEIQLLTEVVCLID